MQKILIIASLFIFTACTQSGFVPVEIAWKDNTNKIFIQWMWVVHNDILITGAHVVRNQKLRYFSWEQEYVLQHIDYLKDRAFLTRSNQIWDMQKSYKFELQWSYWDFVSAFVKRDDKIMALTGIIIEASGSVLGYDAQWRITAIQWIVLTNIQFTPGDSGAPIFNSSWQLLDLVHVQ